MSTDIFTLELSSTKRTVPFTGPSKTAIADTGFVTFNEDVFLVIVINTNINKTNNINVPVGSKDIISVIISIILNVKR
ncbi:hypothetical protein PBCV1_a244L [Paramecium bursaria Chlorella virus 1]|uniref:Uncharacterized protein n=1 Tax=Paramecium bursaria Chlorella virus 1 TaxID=10506 RepID=Q84564_PBCV1|nr:hypothetical protein PBCV1_a244L [Paramecium bursaria Chlorella virus 1]AAC96612.1 hypothetical protein [Paramecium bursaria Chlorella virus 1]